MKNQMDRYRELDYRGEVLTEGISKIPNPFYIPVHCLFKQGEWNRLDHQWFGLSRSIRRKLKAHGFNKANWKPCKRPLTDEEMRDLDRKTPLLRPLIEQMKKEVEDVTLKSIFPTSPDIRHLAAVQPMSAPLPEEIKVNLFCPYP